jgi:cholesterol transport system auxiliary component
MTRKSNQVVSRPGLLLAALLLGGCALLAEKPPVAIHTLKPSIAAAADSAETVEWHLAVDRVRGSELLETTRILVMPEAGELQVYPQTQWSDPPLGLVGGLVTRALHQDGRILGISPSGEGLSADYELRLDLSDFQIEITDAGAQAHVEWQASLAGITQNRIVAARGFSTRTPAAGQSAKAAVAAFDAALTQLLPELVDWVVERGQAHWSERRVRGSTQNEARQASDKTAG